MDFNAITFKNSDVGYIVGGLPNGHRTILTTVNGGSDWSILLNSIGSIIKDISFADSLVGYTVGDSATVMKTMDGGLSWLPILIDTNLTGSESFNAVKFYTQDFGAIGGKAGELYVYNIPLPIYPIVNTLMATQINATTYSARLNGSINAGGFPTAIKFEYGTTTAYGNEINAVPDSISTNDSVTVYAIVNALIPNTTYHFRIIGTNSLVTYYGNDMTFYNGYPEIPNFDFENWDTTFVDFPDNWTGGSGIITKYSPGFSGNYALKIQDATDGSIGIVAMGFGGEDLAFFGGAPFNARPDSMVGWFKYNIAAGDTSNTMLLFKKNGNIFSQSIFKIYGNSGGNFVNLKFPIQYQTSDTPDSLMVFLSCANFFKEMNSPNSWLIVDNIHFTGTNVNIPNSGFEQWHNEKNIALEGWNYSGSHIFPSDSILSPGLIPTADAESKNFAVKLKGKENSPDLGRFQTGTAAHHKFPLNVLHHQLTGYYKYFPQNNDTLSIGIEIYKNSVQIGYGSFYQKDTVDAYTPFVANIIYGGMPEIPDSAIITIQTYNHNILGNSILYIDNLNFDGFLAGIKEPALTNAGNFDFNVYPNPFSEQATVSFTINKEENVIVRLFDISGKQIALLANGRFIAGNHKFDLSANGLKKGFYFCVINTENAVFSKKLIIN